MEEGCETKPVLGQRFCFLRYIIFFRVTFLQCSLLLILLWKTLQPLTLVLPHYVLCHHPHRIFAFLPPLTPLQIAMSRVETWSLKHRRQASRQQLCMTHVHLKNSSVCFISLLLTLHFTPSLTIHPFHLRFSPPITAFGTGDPPRRPVLNPSLTLHAASSSSSLNPHWNPLVSDNQRHLSQEPAAQANDDAS